MKVRRKLDYVRSSAAITVDVGCLDVRLNSDKFDPKSWCQNKRKNPMSAGQLVVSFPTLNISILCETFEMRVLVWESKASYGKAHRDGSGTV